uniref:Fatty acid desaturase domain-containing protein n=1 Tax=Strigamia maritima TaxID=126957 RepID=T1IHS8_STRMM
MSPNKDVMIVEDLTADKPMIPESKEAVPMRIVWRNVVLFTYLHLAAVYGLYLLIFQAKTLTLVWTYVLYILSGMGITAGAHRLWAHRSYKARLPLRIFLALVNAMAFQNHIYEWSRDHRVHHKFSETDADPHNAKRGFFFAHMGWLLTKKHPDVRSKGKSVDMSDLLADPVVRIQKKNINPSENKMVSVCTLGEGHHNYHHTFPWDYSASEWGWRINMTSMFIDAWAKMGLAYDLKHVPKEIVVKRREHNGDGSTPWYDETSCEQYTKGL